MTKYIFVTGGVVSGLGKGITSASLGNLLKARNLTVVNQKLDPYINVDPDTMNPFQHGEVFVTEDGATTDLDLGHYERFTGVNLKRDANVTTGSIYRKVIERERKGSYLGDTVQVIPHITDEIKRRIKGISNDVDVQITEIGGTVGDIESLPYIEAVRQLQWELGDNNALVIHLTLIPYLSAAGELKTKPTQHSVKTLMESGVHADILVCRTEHELSNSIKAKLARFCNVKQEAVIQSIDASTIYDVPNLMLDEGLDKVVLDKLNLKSDEPDLNQWNEFLKRHKNPKSEVIIGLIGKYVELQDSYKSILEAFIHAGAENEVKVKVEPIHSEYLTPENIEFKLQHLDGVLVAPGFGERGLEGKIEAVHYVRKNNIPFLGICLGMQMAVIEYARNVLGIKNANSIEMDENAENPVISLMESQKNVVNKGGTMRLGAWDCDIVEGSIAHSVYNEKHIKERHRHRFEFNNDYKDQIESAGMKATGYNPETGLVEIVEIPGHNWFVGVQYHPEYKSTVANPHPLFVAFVNASLQFKNKK